MSKPQVATDVELIPYAYAEYLAVDGVQTVESGEIRVGISLATDDEGGVVHFTLTRADGRRLAKALHFLDHDLDAFLGGGP